MLPSDSQRSTASASRVLGLKTRAIILGVLSLVINKLKTLRLASTVHPEQTCASSPQFSLVYSKSAPYSTAGNSTIHQDALLNGKISFLIPTTYWTIQPFPCSPESTSSYFCGLLLLVEHMKLVFIFHFDEFLTVVGRKEIFSFLLMQLTAQEAHWKWDFLVY